MSYYWFSRQEILQKAKKKKKRYSKEKDAKYLQNKETIKRSQRINRKTCRKKKRTRLKSIKEKDIGN